MTIMQGDSYPIYIELTQEGNVLPPGMVAELEICVGEQLRKLYSEKEVCFDTESSRWYIHPKQAETLALQPSSYPVFARIRYQNAGTEEVVGLKIGQITVRDGISEAVI